MRLIRLLVVAPVLAASLTAQTQTAAPPDSTPSPPTVPSAANPTPPLRRIGGSVMPPVVLNAPTPQFSEQARAAKIGGSVLVYLEVDTNGAPRHVRVLRGVGMGLDEKAVEAVRQYKFKPATEDGQPVPVAMNVEVNFKVVDHQ